VSDRGGHTDSVAVWLHHDLSRLARFWAQALGRRILSERAREVVIGPDETAPIGMCFMPVPERSCAKERATMTEKRVAKTPEVTGRSIRDARGQVVRPRASALDDGKALGTGWLDLKAERGSGCPTGRFQSHPTMAAMFVGARTDPKVKESVVMRRRS
jgi:hypothetical protein